MKYENNTLKECYYHFILDNGLNVYLMPKCDFHKTVAVFATNYGSKDTEFVPLGKNEFLQTPEGIAHFLEHKLFENEDGTDVANIFAEYGADANAFTTNGQTAYLFSTTSDVEKNIELLLDFVQTPFFNKEGIKKEMGIIEQELLMYLDQPQNIIYYGILKALYKENQIRNEIGGTVDSIKEIKEDYLYTCYETFYHPSNMVLTIVGNFDLDKIYNLVVDNQSKKAFEQAVPIKRKYYVEDINVNEKFSYIEMNTNKTKVAIGLKFPLDELRGKEYLEKVVAVEMLSDIYFGESSKYYEQLLKEGLANNSFEYGVYFDYSYAHLIINLDTEEPEKFFTRIEEILDIAIREEITLEEFSRLKKIYLSKQIKKFNSIDYLANALAETHLDNLRIFDEYEVIAEITLDKIHKYRNFYDKSNLAMFTLYPNHRENAN